MDDGLGAKAEADCSCQGGTKAAAHLADVQKKVAMVGNPNVASAEVDTRGADASAEDADYFKEYKAKQLLRSRCEEGEQQIEVCWEGTEEYEEHTSWQCRDVLIRDGLGLMVRALEKKELHAVSMASAEARAARTAARSSRRS